MMKPDDVPDELVITFCWALWGMPPTGETPARQEARKVLAAVLPAHEAMVRAKVAAEIEAVVDHRLSEGSLTPHEGNVMRLGAEIARGEG